MGAKPADLPVEQPTEMLRAAVGSLDGILSTPATADFASRAQGGRNGSTVSEKAEAPV